MHAFSFLKLPLMIARPYHVSGFFTIKLTLHCIFGTLHPVEQRITQAM